MFILQPKKEVDGIQGSFEPWKQMGCKPTQIARGGAYKDKRRKARGNVKVNQKKEF